MKTKILASALVLASVLGLGSAYAANNATLTVTAPTSIELGKPQDLLIKLAPGGNKVDTVVLAGTYTPDVADISFAVATGATASGSIPASFNVTKPTIDSKTGLFSLTFASLSDTISVDANIVKVTVTPKKAGNFTFTLTQGGEQGTQVILTNSATNILDKANGVTPASTNIAILGDNSTVATSTPAPVVTEMPVVTSEVATDTGAISGTGVVDTTTTATAPKSGPAQTFAILALLLSAVAFVGNRKLNA